ncbi:type IV secretion system DNA-binding domain-containing protein, partial [Clostridium sp. ZBS15]
RVIKIFDPLNEDSPHYDPYIVLRQGDKIQGAREFANSIIPIGADEKDPYWKQSAQNLLTACILHYENENFDFPTTCQNIMQVPINEL